MALETVVYPQEQFGYFYNKEFYASSTSSFPHSISNWESSSCNSMMQNQEKEYYWGISNSSPEAAAACNNVEENQLFLEAADTSGGRRKRRRTARGSNKNREELENQRMIHIAVERNRRKQMNEYLTLLRSLMPSSYVQRADQASIIGGAINFVKEIEQHLQTLEAQKRTSTHQQQHENGISSPLFADFFSFPQYSTTHSNHASSSPEAATNSTEPAAKNRSVMADIEVNLVDSHANLKILSKRRPKQLLKIVAGLQCLCLTILHLNVTTVDQMVLYTLSAKVEEGCQLTTVEEIAQAVNQLLAGIQEEAASR
ncbi:PREDICTED: transcription factor bHLH94-like [Nicotiana attenuata]|uniref:Transcription factor bhlh94 n=1 Tax=Nicotiana attenuata TaxID=49451 RepID=A0A1J6JWJ4_NICAT|nr:PREDICTED: transcription factor bHLH94-like [Nicotiana attenuata]XP_019242175.1 PREDICTED: transcription factor bHLH94-like [Nicotiana attenuata]OIT18811.1 transcription factor bhlh94 [Nicotiana attenuata]OIT20828.1 transcription factor bhlh94 [Nicotiana attenuata]